jgi:hypothetical protein
MMGGMNLDGISESADFGSLGIDQNLLSAISNPDALIEKYSQVAIKQGTRVLLIQAIFFAVITYLIMDAVMNKHSKKKSEV